MLETNLEFLKKRIFEIKIEISRNMASEFQLQVESKVQVKTPKNDEYNTALVIMETEISIPDSDDFIINISAEFVFKFDGTPDNYKVIVEEKCIPLAQKELFDSLDNILIEMGFKKLELSKK